MRRTVDIALKKHAKQQRAVATVAAIVEAATYILARDGQAGFTANKVAEKAGVNIASFYQYYPNKEALLFHIIRLEWERQLARLAPILLASGKDHAAKLRAFIQEFFAIEAAERDLRQALRAASVELHDTSEFQALIAAGNALMRDFLTRAMQFDSAAELDFVVDFTVTLITSFAERTTDARTAGDQLSRQADLLADMLIAQFRIE